MNVRCSICKESYDDARCLTYCPHKEFLTAEEAAQKDLAIRLLQWRNPIRFLHERETGPDYQISAVGRTGMLTIRGPKGECAGQFSPRLFVTSPAYQKQDGLETLIIQTDGNSVTVLRVLRDLTFQMEIESDRGTEPLAFRCSGRLVLQSMETSLYDVGRAITEAIELAKRST